MTPFLFALPDFSDMNVWISLLTLTFMEIVLGVDNIIFISIVANRLPESEQGRARNIGLILAMAFRIILLFGISYLIAMQAPLFHVDFLGFHGGVTGQSIILMLGGIFLIYKATHEIHQKLEGDDDSEQMQKDRGVKTTLTNAVVQIAIINIVFSFDSILTAVGLTDNIAVMMISVIISVGIMMAFAGPVGNFVNKHPTIQMLGLSFLILIGFMLMAEAAHLSHFTEGTVPKGYLYFAIAFSLFVEVLNMRLRKTKPVQLHGELEQAADEGIIEK
jgi:predicted tellurium resistance membrane protein TerC